VLEAKEMEDWTHQDLGLMASERSMLGMGLSLTYWATLLFPLWFPMAGEGKDQQV